MNRSQGPAIVLQWQRAVRDDPAVVGTTLLVAWGASSYGAMDGRDVRPGAVTLARKLGLSERTVREHLTRLVALGYLERVDRGGRHGDQARAAEYRLTFPTGSTAPDGTRPSGAQPPDGKEPHTDEPPRRQQQPNRQLTTSQPAAGDVPTGGGPPPKDLKKNPKKDTHPSGAPSTAPPAPKPRAVVDVDSTWAIRWLEHRLQRPLDEHDEHHRRAALILEGRLAERGCRDSGDLNSLLHAALNMARRGSSP